MLNGLDLKVFCRWPSLRDSTSHYALLAGLYDKVNHSVQVGSTPADQSQLIEAIDLLESELLLQMLTDSPEADKEFATTLLTKLDDGRRQVLQIQTDEPEMLQQLVRRFQQ